MEQLDRHRPLRRLVRIDHVNNSVGIGAVVAREQLEFGVAQRFDERLFAGVRRAVDQDFWSRALGGAHVFRTAARSTQMLLLLAALQRSTAVVSHAVRQLSWAHRC